MKNNEFDKKVKEMFDEFKEDYDPTSWDSFEKKLDSQGEVDDLIKSSLESHQEPFNEEHWDLLVILKDINSTHHTIQKSTNFIVESVIENEPTNTAGLVSNLSEDLISSPSVKAEPLSAAKNLPLPIIESSTVIGTFNSNEPVVSLVSAEEVYNLPTLNIESLILTDSKFGLSSDPELSVEDDGNGFWIGIVAGPDVNFINSPFDLNLVKNPIRSQSGSLTLGLTISKDFGLVEMSTGLMYSNKNYFPRRIREFVPSLNQKYLETNLISLEFEQYQIPLLANMHTRRIGGWSMFGTLGIGINMISRTSYNIQTQVRSFASAPSVSNGLEIDLLELERGALQGGNFGSNIYMSGVAGFGFEKRFKNKFAISGATTYQHSISNEINPVINRAQQLQFNLGAKVNLNK